MIDFGLLVIFVVGGIFAFLLGYFFGYIFGSTRDEVVEPCETIEDIIKREG